MSPEMGPYLNRIIDMHGDGRALAKLRAGGLLLGRAE
jgi:hypothetical protein